MWVIVGAAALGAAALFAIRRSGPQVAVAQLRTQATTIGAIANVVQAINSTLDGLLVLRTLLTGQRIPRPAQPQQVPVQFGQRSADFERSVPVAESA